MKQSYVLDQLVESGKLSLKERNYAGQRFLRSYEIKEGEEPDPGRVGLYGASRDFRFNIAPAVNEYVKNFLYESIPEDLILEGGMKVYTTIEPKRQALALQMMRAQIYSLRQSMLKQNPNADPEKLSKWAERLNGSFVALDALGGKILAVVGGYSITEGSMTQRIWSMLRQPGSSIKGFLYASAIDEEKLHLNSIVMDEPFDIGGYKPRNWNNKYLGEVPLARAMAMSINTIAAKTLHEMGISAFRERLAQALELEIFEKGERFPSNLSLALGSGELSPLELAQIYAALVNGGYFVRPYLITRIEDSKSQVLWESPPKNSSSDPFLSPIACASALKLMEFVFDPDLEGTAAFIGKRRLQDPNYLPFSIAGKTGTVQTPEQHKGRYPGVSGVRDAWFVGIVPQELAVLWFGQDEGVPIPGSGSRAAAAWASYAQRALSKTKIGQTFPETGVIVQTSLPDPELNSEEEGEGTNEEKRDVELRENTQEKREAEEQLGEEQLGKENKREAPPPSSPTIEENANKQIKTKIQEKKKQNSEEAKPKEKASRLDPQSEKNLESQDKTESLPQTRHTKEDKGLETEAPLGEEKP